MTCRPLLRLGTVRVAVPPLNVDEPRTVPSVSSNVTVPEGVAVLVETEAATVAVRVIGVPGATVPDGE